jgi:hypothetical protein
MLNILFSKAIVSFKSLFSSIHVRALKRPGIAPEHTGGWVTPRVPYNRLNLNQNNRSYVSKMTLEPIGLTVMRQIVLLLGRVLASLCLFSLAWASAGAWPSLSSRGVGHGHLIHPPGLSFRSGMHLTIPRPLLIMGVNAFPEISMDK